MQAGEELPPRARRIPCYRHHQKASLGTTSACAENTSTGLGFGKGPWNYLRVRGEYAPASTLFPICVELPPRARRIPAITPSSTAHDMNYLRVRGEYISCLSFFVKCLELPPRARRILLLQSWDLPLEGTTSACAENTHSLLSLRRFLWNYLRVRGEYGYLYRYLL